MTPRKLLATIVRRNGMLIRMTLTAHLIAALASFLQGLTPAAVALAKTPLRAGDTLLQHVRIIDTESGRASRDRSIVIRDGRILALTDQISPVAGVKVIDGGGAFAVPGLWDAHVHIMQESEQASVNHAARLIGYGITHVRDMGAVPEVQRMALAQFKADAADAPYVYRAGPTLWTFDSPYGDTRQRVVLAKPEDMEAGVVKLAAAGDSDFLKVYAGFDQPHLSALEAAAARHHLTLAGHSQPGMTLAAQVQLGMRTVEHVDFSTFAECVPDSDGYFKRVIASRFGESKEAIPAIYAEFAAKADTTTCRESMRSAAAAGLVFTPTLAVGFLDRTATDAAAARLPVQYRESCDIYRRQYTGLSPAEQELLPAAGKRLLSVMTDAGVPILAGTDAPTFCVMPGPSLATELSLMTRFGMSPLSVLQSATRNPSRAFGLPTAIGRIAADEPADIVLFAANPLVHVETYAQPVGLYTQGRWRGSCELAALRRR